jgi:hypothetical protein
MPSLLSGHDRVLCPVYWVDMTEFYVQPTEWILQSSTPNLLSGFDKFLLHLLSQLDKDPAAKIQQLQNLQLLLLHPVIHRRHQYINWEEHTGLPPSSHTLHQLVNRSTKTSCTYVQQCQNPHKQFYFDIYILTTDYMQWNVDTYFIISAF